MAKEQAQRTTGGKAGRTFVWIIIGLLILGLAGFGATGLSGTVRTIGSVGGKPIDAQRYYAALQQQIQILQQQFGRQVTFLEAQSLGLDRVALSQVILERALDAEAARQGLSIGDEAVRTEILSSPAFRGLGGTFDRETYRSVLTRNGLSESGYEQSIRESAARDILQTAIVSPVQAPDIYVDTVLDFIAERRSFSWSRLTGSDLIAPVGEPEAQALTDFYDANPALFTVPETKEITYVWLTPDMVLDEIDVDETLLRETYDDRFSEFNSPERRLVERLVFGNQDDASEARSKISDGEATFEDMVSARGLELADIDLGDVIREDLPEAAAEAVFDAAEGDIVGPVASSLGPALFRVNLILDAQETSFDEASAFLRDDLARDAARRQVSAQRDAIDDLLAAGAELDELTSEGMRIGVISWHGEVEDSIAAYQAFRDAAEVVRDTDFPELLELDDGGLFALRLDETVPSRLQPLEAVRERAIEAWRSAETLAEIENLAEQFIPILEGGAEMTSLGLTEMVEVDIQRGGFIAGAPPAFLERVFELIEGETATVSDLDSVILVRLNEIAPPDSEDAQTAEIKLALEDQLTRGIAQDIFTAFTNAIQTS
ncbi:MAG: SurA N-terminal domain-containing protein, partial [Pseudomonadota bacterium]